MMNTKDRAAVLVAEDTARAYLDLEQQWLDEALALDCPAPVRSPVEQTTKQLSSSGQVGFRKLNHLGDFMLTPSTFVSPLIVAGLVGKDVD
jgi:hypothetical protein